MKRNGNDGIHPPLPSMRVTGHECPKGRAELAATAVLEALYRVGDRTAVLEEGARIRDALREHCARSAKDRGRV